MTFPGLEMTILKFHDFSRFSMTVRTLTSQPGGGDQGKPSRRYPVNSTCFFLFEVSGSGGCVRHTPAMRLCLLAMGDRWWL